MNPKELKALLLRKINSLDRAEYSKNPGKDFTRSRKVPFNILISTILRMEGQSMGNELISIFPRASETPSTSAFVQQRSKLKPGVFDVSIDLNLTRKQTNEVKALLSDRNHYRYLAHSAKLDFILSGHVKLIL